MPRFTVGVEEEFYLVDRRTRRLAPVTRELVGSVQEALTGTVSHELALCQVETSTSVCSSLGELRRAVAEQRTQLRRVAAEHGRGVLCSATPILEAPGPPPLADSPRYRAMSQDFRALLDDQGVSGCHVHIGVPSREIAVLAVNHLRPWLPVLLAITTNSPFCAGRDTGYQSWRHQLWSRWPTAGPPPIVGSVREYDETVAGLRRAGAAADERDVYWFVRASPTWPTIEVRVADVLPTVDEVAGYAGLVRALVRRAIDDVTAARPAPRVPEAVLRAEMWRAARDGVRGSPGPTHHDLIETVRPELELAGDQDAVERFAAALDEHGTGADRQRAAHRRGGSLTAVVDELLLR